jgi:thymidylate kinase
MKRVRIAVDGFDGTGKTTLINKLVQDYEGKYSALVERLIPSSVELFKKFANNTQGYADKMTDQFRVTSYLWESYLRLELKKEIYDDIDIVFFDRWIFTNLTKPINFQKDEQIVSYLISSIPKPDLVFFIYASEDNIIKHLKEKDDWMLAMYSEEEILVKIHEFYKMYEELLKKYSFNYVVLDGNDSIESINRIMKNEIDNLINGAQKGNA